MTREEFWSCCEPGDHRTVYFYGHVDKFLASKRSGTIEKFMIEGIDIRCFIIRDDSGYGMHAYYEAVKEVI